MCTFNVVVEDATFGTLSGTVHAEDMDECAAVAKELWGEACDTDPEQITVKSMVKIG